MVTSTDTTPGRETRLLVPGLSWGPAVQGLAAPAGLVLDGVAQLAGVQPPPRAPIATRHTGGAPSHRRDGPAR